jgi:hypothetical protein
MRGFESRLNPSRPDFNSQDDEARAKVQAVTSRWTQYALGETPTLPRRISYGGSLKNSMSLSRISGLEPFVSSYYKNHL